MMRRSLASLISAVAWVVATAVPATTQTVPAAATPQTGPGRGALANTTEPRTIRLWEDAAPGALGTADADIPVLTFYPPNGRGTGTAVVVAPGGGYGALAMNHEGRQVANWFNAQGVGAFVLRYRLGPRYRHPIELGDAQRAVQLVRARAGEFGVDPTRIGLMGFSAGGHLAATAGTQFTPGRPAAADPVERASSRPDFLVLAYPVITTSGPYVHQGSVRNLLGEAPTQVLLEALSNDRQVTRETPPTFLFHTNADTAVPAENSVLFYLALRKAGVPAEMHVFEPGGHGVGLGMNHPVLQAWPPLLTQWMRNRGLLTPVPPAPPTTPLAPTGRGQ